MAPGEPILTEPDDPAATGPRRTYAAPPRPRLTLRVGITGHRWDKLDAGRKSQLVAQLHGILQHLHDIAGRIVDDPEAGYRPVYFREGEPHPLRPELRILSALAEGADRLAVEAAPKGWRLQALLPFPETVYRRDFPAVPEGAEDPFSFLLDRARAEAGVIVLDGDRQAANAFEPVGTLLCVNSDVLITIWNGQPSAGRGRGGTATVVELARELRIPIIRMAPDASVPAWLDDGHDTVSAHSAGLQGLEARLGRTFGAPPSPFVSEEEGERSVREDIREEYFREGRIRGWRGQLYGVVLRLLNLHVVDRTARTQSWSRLRRAIAAALPVPSAARQAEEARDYGAAIRDRWRGQWCGKVRLPSDFVEPLLATPLADHYGWASRLAAHYAGRYRGAFLLGYSLSWIAVGFGAAGLAVSSLGYLEPEGLLVTSLFELLLLVTILTVVVRARSGAYHERWLAYRQITEALRPLTYALPAGRAAIRRLGDDSERGSWVDWLHRAVVREAGIYPADMTPDHLDRARRLLVEGELVEQIQYHHGNAATLSLAGRRLHLIANLIFWLALLLAALHLKEAIMHEHGPLMSPVVAVLLGIVGLTIPAMASAIHGFVSQAEYEETAQRSRATARQLEQIRVAGSAAGFPRTSAALGDLVAASASAMGDEVGGWFATYQAKGISLP